MWPRQKLLQTNELDGFMDVLDFCIIVIKYQYIDVVLADIS